MFNDLKKKNPNHRGQKKKSLANLKIILRILLCIQKWISAAGHWQQNVPALKTISNKHQLLVRHHVVWHKSFGGAVVHFYFSITSWIVVTGTRNKQALAPHVCLHPATLVVGIWHDSDPELLTNFLALAGMCLITVDLSGNWECWLTLITNAVLGWALQGSPAVPLSSLLTLP